MRTSREIYDQIRWDDRFDASQFFIGYEAHRAEPKEVRYQDFVPGGDIPWHRVLYFRQNSTLVWDRRTRLDRLVPPTDQDNHAHTLIADGQFYSPIVLYQFDGGAGQWVQTTQFKLEKSSEFPAQPLRLVTWNILTDPRETEVIRTDLRMGPIVDELVAQQADVVALQEVTPLVWQALLTHPWIREHYCVSLDPKGSTIEANSTAILTRLPVVALGEHLFAPSKRSVLAQLRVQDMDIYVVTLHLPSDRAANATIVRSQQLENILNAVATAVQAGALVIVAGDFNWIGNDLDAIMARYQLTDAWVQLSPTDPGYTYDPTINTLTRALTRSGRRARFDRVYYSTANVTHRVQHAKLFAQAPIPGYPALFPSDHFGLQVSWELAQPASTTSTTEVVNTAPVHTSALVVIAPEQSAQGIQAIRQQYDKHVGRWMPHITLVYGFVPEVDFTAAVRCIYSAIAEIEPFELVFDTVDRFEHRVNQTIVLRPDQRSTQRMVQLQSALQACFPQCTEQTEHSSSGYQPHLTLAQVSPDDPATKSILERCQQLLPVRFTVREVALLSRQGDRPFTVQHRVALGRSSTEVQRTIEPIEQWIEGKIFSNEHERVIKHVRDACDFALPTEATAEQRPGLGLYVVGAARLGTQGDASDLDAVMLGPADTNAMQFFAAVQEWLLSVGATVRIVQDAFVPIVRAAFSLSERIFTVDVSYAQWSSKVPLMRVTQLTAADVRQFDEGAIRGLSAIRDADALRAVIDSMSSIDVVRGFVRVIKSWAKSRGIYSNAWGYLGGFSWTVLAVWVLIQCSERERFSVTALIQKFFAITAHWNPKSEIVSATPVANGYQRRSNEICIITTPSVPVRNSARNVNRATWQVLQQEFVRAEQIVGQGTLDHDRFVTLTKPWDRERVGQSRLQLTIAGPNRERVLATEGLVTGRVIALLHALSKLEDLALRPDPVREQMQSELFTVTYWVHLGGERVVAPLQQQVQTVIDEFMQSLATSVDTEVTVTLAVQSGK